jgi:hypothetical protein
MFWKLRYNSLMINASLHDVEDMQVSLPTILFGCGLRMVRPAKVATGCHWPFNCPIPMTGCLNKVSFVLAWAIRLQSNILQNEPATV